jgi:hypothetical protein
MNTSLKQNKSSVFNNDKNYEDLSTILERVDIGAAFQS